LSRNDSKFYGNWQEVVVLSFDFQREISISQAADNSKITQKLLAAKWRTSKGELKQPAHFIFGRSSKVQRFPGAGWESA
jgi:hypothetical protein